MPPCIEKARAIMRVLTVDMYNHKAKHERTRLWRMYCSPQIKAYTPDGGESTGYEECDTHITTLQTSPRSSDWKFELTGDLYLIGNTFMQTWFFGKGVEGVEGWSVITVNARGEVVSLHGVVEDARNPSVRQEDEPRNGPPVVALGCWREGGTVEREERVVECGGFEAGGRSSVV